MLLESRIILSIIILTFSIKGLCQQENYVYLDVGLVKNYEHFYSLYSGVVDAGVGYELAVSRNTYAGAGMSLSFFNLQNTPARVVFYKPGINLEYYLHTSPRIALVPQVILSYAFLQNSNKEFNYRDMQTGINPGVKCKVNWKTRNRADFYIFGRFDYIYLNENSDFTRLEYFRRLYLTTFGLGVRFKSDAYE